MSEKKPRSRQIFRRNDLTRAIKGAIASGIEIARAEIDPTGKIVIVFGKSDASVVDETDTIWDAALK